MAIERGEDEVANSADWAEEKPKELEWLSNPTQLFYQIEQSLSVAGKAYLRMAVNPSGYVKAVHYCSPDTIKEIYDQANGDLLHYERNVNGRTVKLTRADMPAERGLEQCVAIYRQDYQAHPEADPAGPSASAASFATAACASPCGL